MKSLFQLILSHLIHSLNIYSHSTSPTLVPSTSTPTTSTPSSNYPSPSIGIITTIAGTGSATYSGDNGQATAAGLYTPRGVDVDTAGKRLYRTNYSHIDLICELTNLNLGNIYIADEFNSRIRKVTVSTGIITTIAGTGTSSYSGDNGPATSATLYDPKDVALDSAGIYKYYFYPLSCAYT